MLNCDGMEASLLLASKKNDASVWDEWWWRKREEEGREKFFYAGEDLLLPFQDEEFRKHRIWGKERLLVNSEPSCSVLRTIVRENLIFTLPYTVGVTDHFSLPNAPRCTTKDETRHSHATTIYRRTLVRLTLGRYSPANCINQVQLLFFLNPCQVAKCRVYTVTPFPMPEELAA